MEAHFLYLKSFVFALSTCVISIVFSTPRYFEGQLTSISETDAEDDVEEAPVRATEAAEKVGLDISIFCLCWVVQ